MVVDPTGNLVDLRYANRVTVRYVRDDEEDSNRVMVAFWGFSSICYLTRDHPEFERIRTTLAAAAARGEPVWFANRTWPVMGETEIWNRILDARPGSEFGAVFEPDGTTVTGRNGTAAVAEKP